MNERFMVDEMEVTVEETPDELRYTFTSPTRPMRALPLAFDVILGVFPLAFAGGVGYAVYTHGASRPAWEVSLACLFIVQMVALVVSTPGVATRASSFLAWRRKLMEIVFTRESYIHRTGSEFDGPVCDIREVRGFRVFVVPGDTDPQANPTSAEPVPDRYGCISVVVGAAHRTQGMFVGPSPESMTTLAHHMHRSLTAFLRANGVESTLDAVEIIETTPEIATTESHTLPQRPPQGLVQQLMWKGFWAVFTHRGLCVVWCLGIFASVAGVIPLLIGAGFGNLVSFYLLAAFAHAAVLIHVWKSTSQSAVAPGK